jgi:hypothetical protein
MKVLFSATLLLPLTVCAAENATGSVAVPKSTLPAETGQAAVSVVARPEIVCPEGSEFKTENKTGVREVWCETQYQEHSAVHGPYKAWLANGQLIAEGNYDNGHMVGAWQYWGIDGRFQGALIYQEGEMVSAALARRK